MVNSAQFNAEEKALLEAILASPEEDTPRLVYADWLDENNCELYARMIRLHIRHAAAMRLGGWEAQKTPQAVRAVYRKIGEIATKDTEYRFRVFVRGEQCRLAILAKQDSPLSPYRMEYTFNRGICSEIRCPWEFWRDYHKRLYQTPALPIRKVTITTKAPLTVYSYEEKEYISWSVYTELNWPEVEFKKEVATPATSTPSSTSWLRFLG